MLCHSCQCCVIAVNVSLLVHNIWHVSARVYTINGATICERVAEGVSPCVIMPKNHCQVPINLIRIAASHLKWPSPCKENRLRITYVYMVDVDATVLIAL